MSLYVVDASVAAKWFFDGKLATGLFARHALWIEDLPA